MQLCKTFHTPHIKNLTTLKQTTANQKSNMAMPLVAQGWWAGRGRPEALDHHSWAQQDSLSPKLRRVTYDNTCVYPGPSCAQASTNTPAQVPPLRHMHAYIQNSKRRHSLLGQFEGSPVGVVWPEVVSVRGQCCGLRRSEEQTLCQAVCKGWSRMRGTPRLPGTCPFQEDSRK